jgi:hypothetical protein
MSNKQTYHFNLKYLDLFLKYQISIHILTHKVQNFIIPNDQQS